MNLSHQLLHRIADPSLTPSERARLRCHLAKELEQTGNYEAAREAMGDLWRGVGHPLMLEGLEKAIAAEVILRAGVLTGQIGSVRQIDEAQETAKNLISESITIFEASEDSKEIAEAQIELAQCYWREGAYDNARAMLREALSRLTDKDSELKAIALYRNAIVEKLATRHNDALKLYKKAARLIENISNHTLKGKFHNGFANLLVNLGQAEHRPDYIDQALVELAAAGYHFELAGQTRHHACVENNLGYLFCTIKKFSKAHEHLDRAQALFTRLRDKVHIAQVDEARARVLLEEGHIAEAEKLSRRAVQALETGGEQSLYAEALTTRGIALARLRDYQDARLTLQNAVVVAQNAGDTEGAGLAALTIIEELGEHLTIDDLNFTFEQALDLLSTSKHATNKDRLLSCARRVLFLVGVLPLMPTWENFSLKEALRRYEGRIIERALKDASGIVTRAAHMLGFKHHTSLINRLNSRHRELLSVRTPIEPRKRSLVFVTDTETRPLLILHIEDTKIIADVVKESLEIEGWTVESFREGTAALKAISSDEPYDVLIFDNGLPDMTGIELIRQTRQIPHRQQTLIIMFSASEVEKEARRDGANAFLKKPDDLNSIAETIARLLARKPKS